MGMATTTRRRTITVDDEISEVEPTRVEISVPLGEVTVARLAAAIAKVRRAAKNANAPDSSMVVLETFSGETIASVRWRID